MMLFLTISSIMAIGASNEETEGGTDSSAPSQSGSLAKSIQELKESIDSQNQDNRCYDRYKLYPTTNTYNLIKLDTRTGKMDMVQWSLDKDKEGTYALNESSLVSSWNDYGCGSFELYSTPNMYQFILLNKVDGRQWHVQWGFEKSERWIRRIF